MRNRFFAAVAAITMISGGSALAQETPSAEGAFVYFINLEDGAVVTSPVKVVFGLSGMGVAPAGVEKDNTGHHHLLVNRAPLGEGPDGADEFSNSLPSDDNHVHFGGGQTEQVLSLAPGTHTLQLVLADLNHVPHDPPVVSEVISITVE